jgi:hypothetical protein
MEKEDSKIELMISESRILGMSIQKILALSTIAIMMVWTFTSIYLSLRMNAGERVVLGYMEEHQKEVREIKDELNKALQDQYAVRAKLAEYELIKAQLLTDISRKESRILTENIVDRKERYLRTWMSENWS